MDKADICRPSPLALTTAITLLKEALALLNDHAPLRRWIELHAQHARHWQIHSNPDCKTVPNADNREKPWVLSKVLQAFFDASNSDDLDVCHWLLKTQKSQIFTPQFSMDRDAMYPISHNPLKVCRLLKEELLPKTSDLYGTKYLETALTWAAKNNNLELCQFLKDWDVVNPRASCGSNTALQVAVMSGNVEVLKILKDWGITGDDVRRVADSWLLYIAAQNQYIDVLHFFKYKWQLTKQDVLKAWDGLAFRIAIERGHVNVLAHFKDHWGFTRDDAQGCYLFRRTLPIAAKNGHVAVLKFFEEHWSLTPDS